MKILIRGTNWVGDAVMSEPAIRAIRQAFPAAVLTLLAPRWIQGLFEESLCLNEVLTFEKTGTRFTDIVAPARLLRQKNFDAALLFTNSFASAFVTKLAGIPKRVGYATESRSFLLTDPIRVPYWKESRHESYYYLNIVAEFASALGRGKMDPDDPGPRLEISSMRDDQAKNILLGVGISPEEHFVAVAAGSTNSMAKRWLPERYGELIARLEKSGVRVLLMGSMNEIDVSGAVRSAANTEVADITGNTDLAQAAAILRRAKLLISNDMGLAHIAPAVGTASIAIFGPTNPTTTRPLGPYAELVNARVECSPCMLRECPIDHRCMTRVSVDEVYDRAMAILHAVSTHRHATT